MLKTVFIIVMNDGTFPSVNKNEGFLNDTDREEAEHSNEIWINGQADLVVKLKNGVIKVYDYKSDAMNGKPMDDFTKELQQKYEGQLALYRYSIKKAFNVDNVETELIHLYM